ncbi:MAG: DUF2723 domain-containing protein [Bacteroidota bacterium]|nr:DUF2723 domain-containing protein [Bacteroidota bacterium]
MNHSINFRRWNNLAGVAVFLLSSFIYLATLEPTVSFWDCGEFLSCAKGLEVCHPSGAPMFTLLGHVAMLFAGGNPAREVWLSNALSAIASGLTIMFLFWTITWFARKLLPASGEVTNRQKILVLFSGLAGSMAYAVSDSFWFSAVETEVYALSSLFTAAVFWLALKWEENADMPGSERWLLLIAYLVGLAIGVHLLNLLAIPAIVLLYYLKKHPLTWTNAFIAIAIGSAILGGILYVLIPGIPIFFSWIEFFSVNSLNLPYNSGFAIGGAVIVAVIGLGLYYFRRKGKVLLYNGIIYLSLVMLGFSSYSLIIIRSHDNPPVDMGNPEDPFALENYLNREQYGSRPLFYGNSFASPVIDTKDRSSYERFNGKYVTMPLNPDYVFDANTLMLFPRMASLTPGDAEAYKQWVSFRGKPYSVTSPNGQTQQIMLPTFGENLRFFLRYQLGFMYFRYFMWNFVGRQNDILGHGNVLYGNWISGIPFLDNARLGAQDKLPANLKTNPGHNVYYCLPLLLGMFGFFFHYRSNLRNFLVLGLLFFFTGIAIVVFLNEVPVTPRERDYVYVGSFYAFAVWIGLGVMWLADFLVRKVKLNTGWAVGVASTVSLGVPVLMTVQNWDDHDRSGRYAVLEYARNYLESCAPNAILFTNADNDTYPLWYAQEVEGIRRDVRIVLLPYLSADWYVNQMRKPSHNSPGLKMTLSEEKLVSGKRTYLPVMERTDSAVDVNDLLAFAGSDDARAKVSSQGGKMFNYIPSRKVELRVNRVNALKSGALRTDKQLKSVDSVHLTIKGSDLRMDDLVLIDILASNNWERPVYFASMQVPTELGINQYLQPDGYAFRLVPYRADARDESNIGLMDTDLQYQKLMKRFSWTSLANPKVYLDNTHIYTLSVVALRSKFADLACALLAEGKKQKAVDVLDKIMTILPNERVAFDHQVPALAELYLAAGEQKRGEALLQKLAEVSRASLDYFRSLPIGYRNGVDYDIRLYLVMLHETIRVAEAYRIVGLSNELSRYWKVLENSLMAELGG